MLKKKDDSNCISNCFPVKKVANKMSRAQVNPNSNSSAPPNELNSSRPGENSNANYGL